MRDIVISRDFVLSALDAAMLLLLHFYGGPQPSFFLQWLAQMCDALAIACLLCKLALPYLGPYECHVKVFVSYRWLAASIILAIGLVADLSCVIRVLYPAILALTYMVANLQTRAAAEPRSCPAVRSPEAEPSFVPSPNNLEMGERTRVKQLLSMEERWIDGVDQGYFVSRHDLSTAYINQKGESILNEYQVCFEELAEKLIEPEEPRRTLRRVIEALVQDAPEGASTRVTLSWEEGEKYKRNDGVEKFKADLFITYSARAWKLKKNHVLVIIKEKETRRHHHPGRWIEEDDELHAVARFKDAAEWDRGKPGPA